MTRPILACLDGAKALRRAVLEVFDAPVIQRCQLHKIRNVRDKLPQRLRPGVERRMRQAYHASSALEAEALLNALARELDTTHPGAAEQRTHDGAADDEVDDPAEQPPRQQVLLLRHRGPHASTSSSPGGSTSRGLSRPRMRCWQSRSSVCGVTTPGA